MTVKKVDVIISGAGPVGLLLAYDLSMKGHSVAIMDPKIGPTDQSRALLVTSRTMEILDGKGLASDILKEAFVVSGMQMIRNGSVFGKVDACGDVTFPYAIVNMQGTTERVIHTRLERDTECRTLWETELVSYTQDANGVTATVKNNKTGEEYTIEGSYIVGADGSHSKVRKSTPGWTYEGVALGTRFMLADLTLKGDRIEEFSHRMNMFNLGTKVMGMVRIRPVVQEEDDSHIYRVFGNIDSYIKNEEDQHRETHGLVDKSEIAIPTLQEVQEYIDGMTAPFKFEASNIIWTAFFKINERMANGYRRDRAFLVGDAAHCHSPAGGQGMNLGIQDADNLAWKLSYALKGQVANPDKLLDSYETEREPHARATIKATSIGTATGLTDNYVMDLMRQTIITIGFGIPRVREFAFKTLTQQYLCIEPEHSKILGTSDKGLIKVGTFFPDTVPLRKRFFSSGLAVIERRTLRAFLVNVHQLSLVLVNTSYPGNVPNEKLVEAFWKKSRSYPVRRIVIQSPWHTHTTSRPRYVEKNEIEDAENGFFVEDRMDDPISATSRVGMLPLLSKSPTSESQPCVLMIIRPDFYVSHACVIRKEADLEQAYESIDAIFK
ncbi:hypothetical protein K501DRAFT_329168 [Backusella circina FSU 941]|nr:hypothetical protein K501DRAFT_329168 [Backusella circina FSU 941]